MTSATRRCLLVSVGILVTALSTPLSAAPTPSPPEPVPGRADLVLEKLSQPAQFTAEADSTLQNALDYLADKYDLKFKVDVHVFAARKIADVRSANIAPGQAWVVKEGSVKEVLSMLLSQGPLAKAGATYVLICDRIVITTEEGAPYRWLRQSVDVDVTQVELSAALKKLAHETGANLVMDARAAKEAQVLVTLQAHDVSLETAVSLLADMAGVKPIRVGRVLYLTTEAHAAELRADKEKAALVGPCPLPADVKIPALP